MPDSDGLLRLGFVGLGTMGWPMAGHLARAGNDVLAWNRTPKGNPDGTRLAKSLEHVADECDVIFLCVRGTEDVAECVRALAGARPDTLFVDHSTISPTGAREIAATASGRGFRFVDAPVTGGSTGAVNGTLTIFLGGADSDVAQAIPLVRAFAKRAEHVGPGGAGQLMKMVNQIAVSGTVVSVAEALSFAKKAGLDLATTVDLVGSGAAGSFSMNLYGPKIVHGDWSPGFSVSNHLKDVEYSIAAAHEVGAVVPGVELLREWLHELQDDGRGADTSAAVYDVLMELQPAP